MKKILITASTGMLGSMLYNVLKDNHELVLLYREEKKLNVLFDTYGIATKYRAIQFDLLNLRKDYEKGFPEMVMGSSLGELWRSVGDVDAVINSAGIIKQNHTSNWGDMLFLNGAVPHILSNIYKEKLIHITTDCVFNGKEGAPYSEQSSHSFNDFYGLSKSIGEPKESSLVLRTSIIGPEIFGNFSLLGWVKKQNNKEINGYLDHLWNGVTTKEFAKICNKIIEKREDFPEVGLFHIFSNNVTKYEMVEKIAEKYKLHIKVNPMKTIPVDRRLTTNFIVNKKLHIPSFEKMLAEL